MQSAIKPRAVARPDAINPRPAASTVLANGPGRTQDAHKTPTGVRGVSLIHRAAATVESRCGMAGVRPRKLDSVVLMTSSITFKVKIKSRSLVSGVQTETNPRLC